MTGSPVSGDNGGVSMNQAVLYIVATPIGNLGDISARAIEVLNAVDVVAAEDTRNTAYLFSQCGIDNRLVSLHEHNESQRLQQVIGWLAEGQSVALVSDAGTPLISDPGYGLVRAARQAGFVVSPIPGASAVIAALSVSGLATDRFCFEGFIPRQKGRRLSSLQALTDEPRSMVFYEAGRRLIETLDAMQAVFGGQRQILLGREITKQFETFIQLTIDELLSTVRADSNQCRGEIVLVVAGAQQQDVSEQEQRRVLSVLLADLPLSQAVAIATRLLDVRRKSLYQLALAIRDQSG